jgi:FMN phosphatase YigB (HAD superfamily)
LLDAKDPAAWIDFEHGRIDEATFYERFFLDRRAWDGPGLKGFMERCYAWMDGMEDLLAELAAAGHAIHALSNYPIWYRMIDDKLRLSRFLQWSFVSCDTGFWKPDSAAFLHAAEALGVEPRACLFIDDREVNVDVARGVGMDAIHKTDAEAVRGELRRRGVTLGMPS